MNETPIAVLVVDDDAFTASLTGMVLEEAGYDVTLAEGGLDALAKVAGNPAIRVVVSDLNMPGMNGVQLFAALREQGLPPLFVLLTGDGEEAQRTLSPGIAAIVTKDEQFEETLTETLAALLPGT
jgi:CheY-like chemotaxis protein